MRGKREGTQPNLKEEKWGMFKRVLLEEVNSGTENRSGERP